MEKEEERLKSWEGVASFTSLNKDLLHPGVHRLFTLDVRLLLESYFSVRR